jgi:hypothetical protein
LQSLKYFSTGNSLVKPTPPIRLKVQEESALELACTRMKSVLARVLDAQRSDLLGHLRGAQLGDGGVDDEGLAGLLQASSAE